MELNETRQSIVATKISDFSNYGKLVKQSLMNSFNINDFIESTAVPDGGSINVDNVENNDDDEAAVKSKTIILLFKCFIIGFIILAAIFGNMLVMVSVMQHRKLR